MPGFTQDFLPPRTQMESIANELGQGQNQDPSFLEFLTQASNQGSLNPEPPPLPAHLQQLVQALRGLKFRSDSPADTPSPFNPQVTRPDENTRPLSYKPETLPFDHETVRGRGLSVIDAKKPDTQLLEQLLRMNTQPVIGTRG